MTSNYEYGKIPQKKCLARNILKKRNSVNKIPNKNVLNLWFNITNLKYYNFMDQE